jgi:hypothetical protein
LKVEKRFDASTHNRLPPMFACSRLTLRCPSDQRRLGAAVHVEGMKDFVALQQYDERASALGTSLVKLVF